MNIWKIGTKTILKTPTEYWWLIITRQDVLSQVTGAGCACVTHIGQLEAVRVGHASCFQLYKYLCGINVMMGLRSCVRCRIGHLEHIIFLNLDNSNLSVRLNESSIFRSSRCYSIAFIDSCIFNLNEIQQKEFESWNVRYRRVVGLLCFTSVE